MSKWLISLVAFLAYAGICEIIYLSCPVAGVLFCPTEKTEIAAEVPTPEVVENLAPIMFNWEDSTAVQTNAFTEAYRQSILSSNDPDNILEITGFYSPNEVNNTDYENLGFARAARIAALFANEIPSERIKLLSRRVNDPSTDPNKLFEFSEMKWVARPEEGTPAEAEKVVKLADREVIYFPYNSSARIKNPELEEYLRDLANELKESGGTVTLTGHTDNVGEEAYNEKLGRSRANDVRKLLVAQGVSASQVEINSMGEREPEARNDTEEGRSRNRRVEVVHNN